MSYDEVQVRRHFIDSTVHILMIPKFIWDWFKTNLMLGTILILLIGIILTSAIQHIYQGMVSQHNTLTSLTRLVSSDAKFAAWLDKMNHACRNHPVCDTRLAGSINVCCYLRHGLAACEKNILRDPRTPQTSCITLRKEILQRFYEQYGRYERDPPSFPVWLTSQMQVLHPESVQAALVELTRGQDTSARKRIANLP